MQIQVLNDGGTHVKIVNPASGETIEQIEVGLDQQVTITAQNEHDPSGLNVGEVEPLQAAAPADSSPDEAEDSGEPAQPLAEGETPEGEPQPPEGEGASEEPCEEGEGA